MIEYKSSLEKKIIRFIESNFAVPCKIVSVISMINVLFSECFCRIFFRAEKELRALMNSFNMIELENSALKEKYEGKKVKEETEPKERIKELKKQLLNLRKQVNVLIFEFSKG